jgi:hypothetical protein
MACSVCSWATSGQSDCYSLYGGRICPGKADLHAGLRVGGLRGHREAAPILWRVLSLSDYGSVGATSIAAS